MRYPACVRVNDITLEEYTEQYRYWLYLPFYEKDKDVKMKSAPLCVILKNPSVANKDICDPTISRVCNVANHHQYPGVIILNLFPYRSTKPQGIRKFFNRSEYQEQMMKNYEIIKQCCTNRDVVYAWGTNTISKSKAFCKEYDDLIHIIINTLHDVVTREWKVMKEPKKDVSNQVYPSEKETTTPLHGLRWSNNSKLSAFDIKNL